MWTHKTTKQKTLMREHTEQKRNLKNSDGSKTEQQNQRPSKDISICLILQQKFDGT